MVNFFITRRPRARLTDIGRGWLTAAVCAIALGTAGAADTHPAERLVRSTIERVTTLVRDETIREDPARFQGLVDETILPHFDFGRMSERALGRNWHKFSPDERVRFSQEFKTLLVANYSSVLRENAEREISFRALRNRKGGRVMVRTVVEGVGNGLPVDYSMYQTPEGWKVYDVAFDGVSLIINFRRGFAQEIKARGAEGLIAKLKERNAGRAR
ncbi:MAG: ABC transporter substrate-binding protein [Pseudomonadota bacterium]